jgi:hypothetical protein
VPVTAANIEPLINMLNAAVQRQDTVRQLAAQLRSDAIWRSPDGSLAVDLTDDQRHQIASIAHAYLDETEVIIATARAILGRVEEGG